MLLNIVCSQTVSAIYALFLAAMLYPEAAKKAREEIDKVVGKDRLPSFADRDNLPYTNALALEVLRWHSVTPTGAHSTKASMTISLTVSSDV